MIDQESILKCNCARCHCELVGRTNTDEVLAAAVEADEPIVAARLVDGERDAPYCSECIVALVPALGGAA